MWKFVVMWGKRLGQGTKGDEGSKFSKVGTISRERKQCGGWAKLEREGGTLWHTKEVTLLFCRL